MVVEEDGNTGSDDDIFGEVGFMFDSALPKDRRLFYFEKDVTVAVRLVDDDPGAVQSGHYVWPAAPALCSYLVRSWQQMPHGKVLELGAGCGLAGLVATQLSGTTAVVFTDHDPGVLDLIRESIAEQGEGSSAGDFTGGEDTAPRVAPAAAFRLSWGPVGEAEYIALAEVLAGLRRGAGHGGINTELSGDADKDGVSFELVIASDVIYSVMVVEPLFQTVSGLLAKSTATQDETIERRQGQMLHEGGERLDTYRQHQHQQADVLSITQQRALTGLDGENAAPLAGLTTTEMEGPPSSRPSPRDTVAQSCTNEISGFAVERPAVNPRYTTAMTCCNDLTSAGSDSEHEPHAAPVFVMSQSFVYDPETEKAIELACQQHGFSRQVLWDELPCTDAKESSPQADRCCASREADQGRLESGVDLQHARKGEGGAHHNVSNRSCNSEGGSGGIHRAGTKLQLFWRA